MNVHVIPLAGCSPRPLAAYLKALGVLRVVNAQADPEVRGLWRDGAFVLWTRLSREELVHFFLWDWEPSPFMSPWNKGSKLLVDGDKGVQPLVDSTARRFAPIRQAICSARAVAQPMGEAIAREAAIKDEAKRLKSSAAKDALRKSDDYAARLEAAQKECKRLKDQLQPECLRRWRGPTLDWLRTAFVLREDGTARFPALVGTGGNDLKLDFTNNAMQRLGDLFDLRSADGAPRERSADRLKAALFGATTRSRLKGGIGQFDPLASGGPNATGGALADSQLNPWDLPLLLEGSLTFTVSANRRLATSGERTAAPFSTRSWAAGYGSASQTDENPRGEQWMPLWSRPWTAREVAALLTEGRCQLGTRGSESAMDMARAVATLGVARGVDAFERYGFIERNGKSNYAVPLGRWRVRAEPHSQLLDDLDTRGWWSRLGRAARDAHAPASLARTERRLSEAAMSALGHGGPQRWEAVLFALTAVEEQLVRSGTFTAKKGLAPIPPLSPEWIAAVDSGGPELPLALSLAGAGAAIAASGRPHDPLRGHWLPLDRWGRFAVRESDLANDPRVVANTGDLVRDLLAIIQRRLIEAGSGASRTLPIQARVGAAASPRQVAEWLSGAVDDTRIWALARALAAVDWSRFEPRHAPDRRRQPGPAIDPVWAAARLCHLPGPLPDARRIPVDPAIVRLLGAGESARALAFVRHRLVGAGLVLPFTVAAVDPRLSRRLAASLAFPVTMRAAATLARDLDPKSARAAQEISP